MKPLPAPVRSARAAATALVLAAASLTAVATATGPARADTEICTAYGTGVIQDHYVVQNNRWGTSEAQCINVTDSGFRITQADGAASTDGPPKSYPSVYDGCHYDNCSPGTALPKQISAIGSAQSSVSYGYADGAVFDAAYDIWLDPEPRTDGVNQTEIMIWFNHQGPVQPVGSQTGTAAVGGKNWQVWTGNNGGNDVISFVADTPMDSWSFDVKDFITETVNQGLAQDSWYLTSIQAGFEPWEGGAGLAVNSFSTAVG